MKDITPGKIAGLLLLCIATVSLYSLENGASEPQSLDQRIDLLEEALRYEGVPYEYGGESFSGIDCSGLVQQVYAAAVDLVLPRTVELLRQEGVVTGRPYPGDLVFFDTTGLGITHVGIYLGNNEFLHAASSGPQTGVIRSSLTETYYHERYEGARRYIEVAPTVVYLDYTNTSNEEAVQVVAGQRVRLEMRVPPEFLDRRIEMEVRRDGRSLYTKTRVSAPVLTEYLFVSEAGDWAVLLRFNGQTETVLLSVH